MLWALLVAPGVAIIDYANCIEERKSYLWWDEVDHNFNDRFVEEETCIESLYFNTRSLALLSPLLRLEFDCPLLIKGQSHGGRFTHHTLVLYKSATLEH
jgi:hypothetical protein